MNSRPLGRVYKERFFLTKGKVLFDSRKGSFEIHVIFERTFPMSADFLKEPFLFSRLFEGTFPVLHGTFPQSNVSYKEPFLHQTCLTRNLSSIEHVLQVKGSLTFWTDQGHLGI